MYRSVSTRIRGSGAVALAGLLLVAAACSEDHGSTPTPLPPTPGPAPVASVVFAESALRVSVAESRQLQVTLRTAGGETVAGRPITWQSSDTLVATVSAGGVVRALNPGRTTISATSGSARGEMTLEVATPPNLPALTAIVPATVTAWTSDFTLTLTGSRFSPAAWVRIGGAILIPEFVSETELRVLVGANHILQPGDLAIRVTNPIVGGGTSEAVILKVESHPDTRPAPVLTALSRDTVYVGTAERTLTLTGKDFVPASRVRVSGWDRPTTFVDSTTVQVVLSAQDVERERNHYVNVMTPGPGGGSTTHLLLMVRSAPMP
jgi:hypothetical protein